MDIGSSFTYPFDDQDWIKKVLIGAVVGLIPIVGPLLQMGYSVEALRRTIDRTPVPLPEWDDWGGKLVKGLVYWVISFIYALPLILVVACVSGVGVALTGALNGDSDTAGTVIALIQICFGCLAFIYSLALGLVLPAAIARYAAFGEFGAAFQFGQVLAMVRDNIGTYLIVLVMSLVAGLVASLGVIACVVGVLVTAFYAQLVIAHLYGSAYNVATSGSTAVGEPVV